MNPPRNRLVTHRSRAGSPAPVQARELQRRLPHIAIDASSRRRAEYARDASNYQLTPAAVAFPSRVSEVSDLLKQCDSLGLPVHARGGGTSMAGNVLGMGVVVDLSRHMNHIIAVDTERRVAQVQAGATPDQLHATIEQLGLSFGPDPSSHARCTIGGMIANDACGNRSVKFGRTVDHVNALTVVLPGGIQARVEAERIVALQASDTASVAAVEEQLRALGNKFAGAIRSARRQMPRQVSGYQLHHLLPESLHLARALAGSEGTCAVIAEATVHLVPSAKHRAMLVAGYRNAVDAAADIPLVLDYRPSAVEGMDDHLVGMLRGDRPSAALRILPPGSAWLLIEVDGESTADASSITQQLRRELLRAARALDVRLIPSLADQRSLWSIREDGAGLAARGGDHTAYWPGWEDAAVPPERLSAYLADFVELRVQHGYTGALYGHFGAGCVHTRLDFDLATRSGRHRMDRFVADAARLVVAHGGSLSGEHGDGRARSALLPLMYEPAMLQAFEAFKHAWDPRDGLNPSIIVAPQPVTENIPQPPPGSRAGRGEMFRYDGDDRLDLAVGRCVGLAKCRSKTGGFMCPSYRATGDEKDSTRGRARVLQQLAQGPSASLELTAKDAKSALDLCLACKACARECPTGVDMATYKAELLHSYYRRRLRPASHVALGWLPLWTRLVTAVPGLSRPVNWAFRQPGVAGIAARLAGLAIERPVPALRPTRHRPAAANPRSILLLDTFSLAFRPSVIHATRTVLNAASLPAIDAPTSACCALTWISTGQLRVARRVLARTTAILTAPPYQDLPIVVPEPSCASALAHDLPRLLSTPGARDVAARIHTLPAALQTLAPHWRPAGRGPSEVVLQTHCHEHATFSQAATLQTLATIGCDTVTTVAGCCGMAGNFGYERDHYATSQKVADQALLPALVAKPHSQLIADGFSCMLQAEHLADRSSLHLAELLANALQEPGASLAAAHEDAPNRRPIHRKAAPPW